VVTIVTLVRKGSRPGPPANNPLTKFPAAMSESTLDQKPLRAGESDTVKTGELLIAAGLITPAQLAISLRQQESLREAGRHLFIEQILVRNRFVSRDQISKAIHRQTGGGDSGLFQTILPLRVCKQYSVFPTRVDNGVLLLRAARALSERDLASIKSFTQIEIVAIKVIPTDLPEIIETLKRTMTSEYSFSTLLEGMKTQDINGGTLRQAINGLMNEAIELLASDIHMDRKDDQESWISYRVDGKLQMHHLLPRQLMAAIFTRLKTESGMDASETRKPQDGRISLETNGRLIDFRVATQPVVGGETMSMRVLDPESLLGLDALFPGQPDMTELFKKISRVDGKNGGLVLFSGPTGSGKTTSMYALAQMFPRDQSNVLTVEDPVEFVLPLARQIQLNQILNEKSMNVERSMLRQDPDVLIIGEIRDSDSMRAALRFAESGHLVLASVHARNAMQTIERLISFADQEERNTILYMLANTLRVVVNQRLVIRLCTCAVPVVEDPSAPRRAVPHGLTGPLTYKRASRKPAGCQVCGGSGYKGRVASHETIVISTDEDVRQEITALLFQSIQNVSQIRKLKGVLYQDRKSTLDVLEYAGVIDEKTVQQENDQDLV
jgi:type II secretory ATPase GspE/PulE/Tfp pilus assembly ATPase PilB-like protein